MENNNSLMSLGEAASWLNVSKPTIYLWLKQNKIKGFKAGKLWRFYQKDLENVLRPAEDKTAVNIF